MFSYINRVSNVSSVQKVNVDIHSQGMAVAILIGQPQSDNMITTPGKFGENSEILSHETEKSRLLEEKQRRTACE